MFEKCSYGPWLLRLVFVTQRPRRDADNAGADGRRGVARGAHGAGGHAVARRAQPGRYHAALPRLHAAGAAARASATDPAVFRFVAFTHYSNLLVSC